MYAQKVKSGQARAARSGPAEPAERSPAVAA
jgi:hypothetical protein